MRSFADLDTLIGAVPRGIVTRLSVVDAGRGSEALYADQLPGLLKALADAARVESVIASSAIEGIVVEQARAERIVRGADQRLPVRNEKELAGHRDALDYLFQNDPGDLASGHALLHIRACRSVQHRAGDRTPPPCASCRTVRTRFPHCPPLRRRQRAAVSPAQHASAVPGRLRRRALRLPRGTHLRTARRLLRRSGRIDRWLARQYA